jgi:hypothetical protein
VQRRRAGRDLLELVLRRAVRLGLQVARDDDRGRGPTRQGRPDRAVDRQRQLLRDVDLDEVLARHILEQRLQVDLLLVGAAHRAALGLPDDGDDRHVVEFGVVQTVQQVDRARAGGGQADADLARELRVPDGLQRAHLLVPRLDERRRVVGLAERGDDAVDAVAGVGEDLLDPPLPQPPQDVVPHRLRHVRTVPASSPCAVSRGLPDLDELTPRS